MAELERTCPDLKTLGVWKHCPGQPHVVGASIQLKFTAPGMKCIRGPDCLLALWVFTLCAACPVTWNSLHTWGSRLRLTPLYSLLFPPSTLHSVGRQLLLMTEGVFIRKKYLWNLPNKIHAIVLLFYMKGQWYLFIWWKVFNPQEMKR